jgi:hypothetical protein
MRETMSENRQRSSNNPYRTVSASERRARRRAREGTPASQVKTPTEKATAVLPQEMIEELLHNPTKMVTEEQLRGEYGYVVADIRNMGILAAGLVVLLIALATFLPR